MSVVCENGLELICNSFLLIQGIVRRRVRRKHIRVYNL
jgi:hypothetical protein